MILILKRATAGLIITIITLLVPITLFALVAFFPILTCHGEGAGGNCGEGMMVSLPIALLLSPLYIYAMVATGNRLMASIWPKASPPPIPPFS